MAANPATVARLANIVAELCAEVGLTGEAFPPADSNLNSTDVGKLLKIKKDTAVRKIKKTGLSFSLGGRPHIRASDLHLLNGRAVRK